MFSLKSATGQGYSLSPLLFNVVLNILSTEIRQEKEKGIEIENEIEKLFLFSDDKTLYTQNTKDFNNKKI